jgi:hypothetical protein
MSSTLLSRATGARRRTVSGLVATALAAATLAVTPGAAQAAEGDPALSWNVSTQFVDHFTKASFNNNTLVASSGARYDAATKSATFEQLDGWVNPVTKTASVQYDGSLKGSFISLANALQYSIEISDPQVVLAADGTGQVVADVAWEVPSNTPTTGSSQDVVVTTFAGADATWGTQGDDVTLAATPAFKDVLPAGSQAATDLGLTTNSSGTPVPIDGAAFAPSFLGALPSSLRAHFYKSGSASGDPKKAPSAFTAAAALPSLTARTVASTPEGLEIEVSGQGYMAGGVGVYVSLGSAFSATDPSAFVATNWVNAIAANGTFTTLLKVPADKVATLDPAKTWSLSTQKAHGQSATDASQTVVLPADLDFSTLKRQATTLSAKALSTPVGKAATLTVDVDSTRPVGEGTVTLSGVGATLTAPVKDGVATLDLPATLPAGAHTATLSFAQTTFFAPSTGTVKVTVEKGSAVVTAPSSTSSTFGDPATIAVGVQGDAVTPTGTVTVEGLGTSTLVDGKAVVTAPADLAVGTRSYDVTYSGDARYTGSTSTTSITVAKAASSVTAPDLTTSAGKTSRLVVKVSGGKADAAATPSGTVSVPGLGSAPVGTKGQASLPVPSDLPVGVHEYEVTYAGDARYHGSTDTVKVTVAKAATAAPRLSLGLAATTVRSGRATIDLTAGGVQPTGKVAVTFAKRAERRAVTGTLVRGRASVVVPALSAGTWRATVTYAGDRQQAAATATTTFVVRKASIAKPAVKVTRKPTTRKAGAARVTVRSATSGRPTGKVRVQLVKGRSTKSYTVRLNSKGQATVKTSKLAKGTWKVYVTYYGDTRFDSRSKTRVTNVKVTR